jgi:tetratricopeptide (TPR) repeat protein
MAQVESSEVQGGGMSFISRFLRGITGRPTAQEEQIEFIYPKEVSWNVKDVHKLEDDGQFQEALKRWQMMLSIFHLPQFPPEHLKLPSHRYVQFHIGQCYRHLQMYDDALRAYAKTRILARETNDQEMLAEVANNVGIVHRLRGDHTAALREYEDALAKATHLKQWNVIVSVLDNMSVCYWTQGDKERAFTERTKAYGILQKKSSQVTPLVQSRVLANLGVHYLEIGQPQVGRRFLEKGLDKAREAGSRVQEALILEALSRVL